MQSGGQHRLFAGVVRLAKAPQPDPRASAPLILPFGPPLPAEHLLARVGAALGFKPCNHRLEATVHHADHALHIAIEYAKLLVTRSGEHLRFMDDGPDGLIV